MKRRSTVRGAIRRWLPGAVLVLASAAASAQMAPATDAVEDPATALPPPPRAPVTIAPAEATAIGLRIEAARNERVAESLRAVAVVVLDEAKVLHVPSPVAGWIEALPGAAVGQAVQQGEAIASVSSPELVTAQNEYLAALRDARFGPRGATLENARGRLKDLGVGDAAIAVIEASGEPLSRIDVAAPGSGVVLRRPVGIGAMVDATTELMTIADLSSVWIIAEVPESGRGLARIGTNATIDFSSSGRKAFVARIDYVYPTPEQRTRTRRVRFVVANGDGKLRPGQYGNVDFHGPSHDAVTVPRDALVEIGAGQYTWVEVAPDHFEPRSVVPGARIGDRVEIRAGLAGGDRVVAAGVFLLDAESQLQTPAPRLNP
ncbi:MAG: efflux RND transporter periplasmic adaptor subunit [Gammaproteobacteria bacterium]|nr:efflux RND transporter periplasmic adaptor subunit [Gammaproteobacteria bacterium]